VSPDIDEMLEVREIKFKEAPGGEQVGRPLAELELPGTTAVLTVQRQGSLLLPDAGMVLLPNDVLTLVGSGDDLDLASRRLSASR
jgi:Trk K+ transport system NAD-binding subunit